jgi:predicted enzyme related to lactoylglutathione lyase
MMGTRTSYEAGTFSWVELATPDPDDAKRFYGGLFGWDFEDDDRLGRAVSMTARLDDEAVAGITERPASPGARGVPPGWVSYVTVANADESALRAGDLGGTVHVEPFDVGSAARVAVVADPTGAVIGLWEARSSIGAERVNGPGCLTSNELATDDVDAASKFYRELFGWAIDEVDTGGGPRYWLIHGEGALEGRNGGMRELGPAAGGISPSWVPYFTTDSVGKALARADELGGATLMPATQIPAGIIAAVLDPQGAVFSIFEGDVDD